MVALVLTACVKRERVTEIIVKTVALRKVVDVDADLDSVALVVNMVSSG